MGLKLCHFQIHIVVTTTNLRMRIFLAIFVIMATIYSVSGLRLGFYYDKSYCSAWNVEKTFERTVNAGGPLGACTRIGYPHMGSMGYQTKEERMCMAMSICYYYNKHYGQKLQIVKK